MNRVRVTVDDLRRASDAEIRHKWSSRQWLRWLDAAAILQDHTFRNVILIKLQLPEATQVASRTAWHRKGRMVRRGQSGIRIIAPGEENHLDLAAGSVQGHGVATVWDASQLSGRFSLPLSVTAGAEITEPALHHALTQVATNAGYIVASKSNLPDDQLVTTDHTGRRISIRDDLDSTVVFATLAHELAHVRMHKLSRGSTCHGLIQLEADRSPTCSSRTSADPLE